MTREAGLLRAVGALLAMAWAWSGCDSQRDELGNPFFFRRLAAAEDFDVTPDGTIFSSGIDSHGVGVVERTDPDSRTTTLWSGDGVGKVRVSDGHVYVEAPNVHSSWSFARLPIDGGTFEVIDDTTPSLGGFAVDDAYVYSYSLDALPSGTITRRPIGGGSVEILAPFGFPFGLELGVDEADIYYIDTFDLKRLPKLGGTPQTMFAGGDVLPNPVTPSVLAVGASDVIVGSADGWFGGEGGVFRISKVDGTAQQIEYGDGWVEAVAVDAEYVYRARVSAIDSTDHVTFCEIARIPIAGGPVRIIATNQRDVSRIVVNRERVIWNDGGVGILASVRLDALAP